MIYNFDEPADRRNTGSVKWDPEAIARVCGNPNAEPFWVADMDFQMAPEIEATAKKCADGVFGYPVNRHLPEIFSKWLVEKHDWSCDPERIVWASGLLHAVALAVQLFTKPGDGILVPSPTYKPFRSIVESNDRVFIDHPLKYENGVFSLDHDRFLEDCKNAKMILFCSPHNPSGLVFSDEDLKRVLMCGRHFDIPVLSDEIHADLAHPGAKHIPMGLRNTDIGAKNITFMAPSKTFNVAGEHSCMVIFDDPWMQKKFTHAQEALRVHETPFTSGALTVTCYTECLEFNRQLCEYLGGNMTAMREYLEKNVPELVLANGAASFVTFIDCAAIYDKVEKIVSENPERYPEAVEGGPLSKFFGVEAGICVNDGAWFGAQYKTFVRFNCGTCRKDVMHALEKMGEAVAKIR